MRTAERLVQVRPIPLVAAPEQGHRGLAYRPALDGLRAIAVLAVVAYHLGYTQVRGGFLGVDVFFVLSGFLITTLLLLEHQRTGTVSLRAFWGRRARRLLPALLLVLLAVAVWEWGTAAAYELPQRRTDLLWALFYGSNWNLVATAQDYFAQYDTASLVRHTWSLAIEEQFYILWPLIVLGALRLAGGRTRALLGVCVAGIGVSVAMMAVLYSPADPSRAYYGTEARVHQLLIGALLAVALARSEAFRRPRRIGSAAAATGLVLLVVAIATLGDGNTAYYHGVSALVALATALLVWGLEVAPYGAPARALGIAPMRWVGRVSYGIYLWHWPVILAIGTPAAVFAWMPGSLGLTATRVLFTALLAGLSFHLVERPIREGTVPLIRGSLVRFGVAIGAATLALAFAIVSLTTLPSEREWATGSAALDKLGCDFEVCVRYEAPAPGAPVVAVIGDSIARSLDVGMIDLAEQQGWTYVIAASGGCRITHLLTSVEGDSEKYEPCYEATPGLLRELLDTWQPDLVIALDSVELADQVDGSGPVVTASDAEHLESERREFERITQTFTASGSRLVYVGIPPFVTPPDCLREDTQELDVCAIPASNDRFADPFNEMLAEVASGFAGDAYVVSITEHLCPGGICRPMVQEIVPRYDGHHFTAEGARWIVPLLHAELVRAGALPPSMA